MYVHVSVCMSVCVQHNPCTQCNKVLPTFRHCFDVEQPGFQATTSRYIYTYLTNGVLLVFYDFDTPLWSIWNNCSTQREIPVCSLLPSYVTLLSPFCVYMYNVSEALQHLIEMLSCQSSNKHKIIGSCQFKHEYSRRGVRLHTNVTSDHYAYLYFGILTSD